MWGTPASLPLHTDWLHEHVMDALTPFKVNVNEVSLNPSEGQVSALQAGCTTLLHSSALNEIVHRES